MVKFAAPTAPSVSFIDTLINNCPVAFVSLIGIIIVIFGATSSIILLIVILLVILYFMRNKFKKKSFAYFKDGFKRKKKNEKELQNPFNGG